MKFKNKSDWNLRPLIEVTTLQRGYDLPVKKRKEGPYIVYAANGPHGNHCEGKIKGPGVITGRSGTIGKIHFSKDDFWPLNTSLFVKDFHGNDPKWVYYMLQNFRLERFAQGAGVPTLNRNLVHDIEIPLPPLPEQKRIATILDQADAIRRKRQQAIQLADDFLRATFLHMFGDPVTNPKGWEVKNILELSTRVTKGESPKWQGFEYQEKGVLFVTSENVLWGCLNNNKRKYVPKDFHKKLKRSQLKENDLLINLVGASVGRACLVPEKVLPANINQAVSVTTLDAAQVVPQFVLQQVLTPQIQKILLGNAVDFARANISLTNIRELEIICPPITEQMKWGVLISKVSSIVSNQNLLINQSQNLFNSLTQRAFRGEL